MGYASVALLERDSEHSSLRLGVGLMKTKDDS